MSRTEVPASPNPITSMFNQIREGIELPDGSRCKLAMPEDIKYEALALLGDVPGGALSYDQPAENGSTLNDGTAAMHTLEAAYAEYQAVVTALIKHINNHKITPEIIEERIAFMRDTAERFPHLNIHINGISDKSKHNGATSL